MNVIKSGSLACSYTTLKSIITKEWNFSLFTACFILHLEAGPLGPSVHTCCVAQHLHGGTETNGDWLPQVGLANEECLHHQQPPKPICKCRDKAVHQACSQKHHFSFGFLALFGWSRNINGRNLICGRGTHYNQTHTSRGNSSKISKTTGQHHTKSTKKMWLFKSLMDVGSNLWLDCSYCTCLLSILFSNSW